MTRAQALDALIVRLRECHLDNDRFARELDEAADALDLLRAQNEAMREALQQASDQFHSYVALHRAKQTPDGDAKADSNLAMASVCGASLPSEPAGWPASVVEFVRATSHRLAATGILDHADAVKEVDLCMDALPASLRDAAKEPSNG